jgi:hypothetical protein
MQSLPSSATDYRAGQVDPGLAAEDAETRESAPAGFG